MRRIIHLTRTPADARGDFRIDFHYGEGVSYTLHVSEEEVRDLKNQVDILLGLNDQAP